MKETIIPYLRAGYSCLQILTHEEARAVGAIHAAAAALEYHLWSWSVTTGLCEVYQNSDGETVTKAEANTAEPAAALKAFKEGKIQDKSVVILRDFHVALKGHPMILTRLLRDCIEIGRATNRHLILVGCRLELPPEVEKEVTVIELQLPTRDELLVLAKELAAGVDQELNGDTDAILNAGCGLTTLGFNDAASYAIVKTGSITPMVVADLKADAIKKSGILEILPPGITFNDIGGLDALKEWISRRKRAFTKDAVSYGLPTPKGVCLYGVQGGGKTVATRAIAAELGCPLIRLDAGRLFGGIVGSSEANTRGVIQLVEAFGQCVLMIDEIDKGFAGMVGGHDGDNGVTRRVIGSFLTWMAEKKSPVFIVATANDLTRLPPELLRKGRWDELFFIDLPTAVERQAIWAVQIRRHGRKPEAYDLEKLAACTPEWTGAEIEALMGEGLYAAFETGGEPTTDLLVALSKETAPLSKTMGPQLDALRDWSVGRSRMASRQEVKAVALKRKVAA